MLHRILWHIREVVFRTKKESAAPATSTVRSPGRTQPTLAETDQQNSATLPDFQFETELPAEAFFLETRGDTISGNFDPIDQASISFINAEWDLDHLDTSTVSDHSRQPGTVSSPLSDLRSSVKRLRAQAERDRLLSPKSALALAKLETGKAKLTGSDLNALQYLLSRLRDNKQTSSDVALVAEHLLRK
jgi:hypothetical protein